MEKRNSRRYIVFIAGVIISGDKSYAGVVGNISENGMYVRIKSADAGINFAPGTISDLKIKLPSEETLNLRCRLVWSYEILPVKSSGKSAYNLGMEIKSPSQEYRKFYIETAMGKINDQIKSLS